MFTELRASSIDSRHLSKTFGRRRLPAAWIALAAVIFFTDGIATSMLAAEAVKDAGKAVGEPKWESLFDGKTLKGWKTPDFGGQGKVEVKDGAIVLHRGNAGMTGIAWTGKVPTVDYELTLEGKRIDGTDFFCATTFPVGKSHCTFVVGGWGGPIVGLSSVDYYDAADNETTRIKDFKLNQWYRIRIRVTAEKIECWIDDEQMVDLQYVHWETEDGKKIKKERKISIRYECDLCRPLGISTWDTGGAVRSIRLRRLGEANEPQITTSAARCF